MHDGAVAARAGDGVERHVAQARRWRGESLPASRPRRSRSARRRRHCSANQARKRASAAPSRICALRMPSISSAVLAGLGQLAGIGAAAGSSRPPCAAGRRWRLRRWRDRPARSCLSCASSAAANSPGSCTRTLIAQMRHQFGTALGGIQEQVGAAIVMQNGKGQREGRVRHVMAADVEQPADANPPG